MVLDGQRCPLFRTVFIVNGLLLFSLMQFFVDGLLLLLQVVVGSHHHLLLQAVVVGQHLLLLQAVVVGEHLLLLQELSLASTSSSFCSSSTASSSFCNLSSSASSFCSLSEGPPPFAVRRRRPPPPFATCRRQPPPFAACRRGLLLLQFVVDGLLLLLQLVVVGLPFAAWRRRPPPPPPFADCRRSPSSSPLAFKLCHRPDPADDAPCDGGGGSCCHCRCLEYRHFLHTAIHLKHFTQTVHSQIFLKHFEFKFTLN